MNEFLPDLYFDNTTLNPCIFSPNADYALFFGQTSDILNTDTELFKKFVDNAVSLFRKTKVYTGYKAYLYNIGLNRCQYLGNITTEMATIEMHHNGLTIFDIAVIITNHLLKTSNNVTVFDVVHHLRYLHINNKVPIVMLCKTVHQINHNDSDFFCPCQMTYGNWIKLLEEYKLGLTYGIAKKLVNWINQSINSLKEDTLNTRLLELNKSIIEWSECNEYGYNNNSYNNLYNPTTVGFRNIYFIK